LVLFLSREKVHKKIYLEDNGLRRRAFKNIIFCKQLLILFLKRVP
jgi:hypothetical protein